MKKLVLATIIAASSTGAMAEHVEQSGTADIQDILHIESTCSIAVSDSDVDTTFGEVFTIIPTSNVQQGNLVLDFTDFDHHDDLAGVELVKSDDPSTTYHDETGVAVVSGEALGVKFTTTTNTDALPAGDYFARATVEAKCTPTN
ncbi:MAG: hypothetical protein GKR86_00255 [Ilumatobacter sp.]|nr:hypothetical protein [Ilumatobacter sp.]